MPSYLDRYLAGEHEPVWDELYSLGDLARESAIYEEALAVARETMRRVRANIELLIPRLVKIGYQFGYDWRIQPKSEEPLDIYWYHWYLTDEIEWAKHQPPVFTPATFRVDYLMNPRAFNYLENRISTVTLEIAENIEQSKDYIDALDEELDGIPLSLRA